MRNLCVRILQKTASYIPCNGGRRQEKRKKLPKRRRLCPRISVPGHPVENLHLKNVQIAGDTVEEISFVEGLHLENVSFIKNEPFDRAVLGGKQE